VSLQWDEDGRKIEGGNPGQDNPEDKQAIEDVQYSIQGLIPFYWIGIKSG